MKKPKIREARRPQEAMERFDRLLRAMSPGPVRDREAAIGSVRLPAKTPKSRPRKT